MKSKWKEPHKPLLMMFGNHLQGLENQPSITLQEQEFFIWSLGRVERKNPSLSDDSLMIFLSPPSPFF